MDADVFVVRFLGDVWSDDGEASATTLVCKCVVIITYYSRINQEDWDKISMVRVFVSVCVCEYSGDVARQRRPRRKPRSNSLASESSDMLLFVVVVVVVAVVL